MTDSQLIVKLVGIVVALTLGAVFILSGPEGLAASLRGFFAV